MYLLDTGVVFELRRPEPHPSLVRWITEAPSDQLFLSAATLGEVQAGIENVRDWDPGSATRLEVWLDAVIESGAVLPMDAECFREHARIQHRRPSAVSSVAMIAATARVHRLTVVTRDGRDYRRLGIGCVNPFEL